MPPTSARSVADGQLGCLRVEASAVAQHPGETVEGGELALGGGEARRRRLDREDPSQGARFAQRVDHRVQRGAHLQRPLGR